jgi:serine/threonine-protein kinase
MNVFHPDQLRPGDMVGAWRIQKSLGSGGMGHVFQVEHKGHAYVLKMALRPASTGVPPGEEDVDRRMGHEAAFHLSHESLPGVLRVVEVSRWPDAREGYRTLVTEHVEGETFHEWRSRTRPSAAKLLEVVEGLVRTVAELHRRGIHHRDLKADNLLVSREEERPYLIDFGMVSLPGAATLTQAGLVGTLHTVPPEMLAFFRAETWKHGERFRGGVAGDLYALGVLLYEALTDCHPFDPRLPVQELAAAIEARMPPAPHELNPGVPRALSDIAMHLLAKTPEARPASAEALLQALWEAKKEARTHTWRVPLSMPPEGVGRQRLGAEQLPHAEPEHGDASSSSAQEEGLGDAGAQEPPAAGVLSRARWTLGLLWAFTPRRVRWLLAGLGALLALGLIWAALTPQPLKGSAPVSTHAPRLSRLLFLLCTSTGLGCPGAQVKPPQREDCPDEVYRVMREELRITEGSPLRAIVDVNQPGDQSEVGTYRDGPLTGIITHGEGGLPEGTLLWGQLWTGPGIYEDRRPPAEAVIARYTRARLPDGREVPVCIVLGGPDGRVPKVEGSTAEAVLLPRELPANAVWTWP